MTGSVVIVHVVIVRSRNEAFGSVDAGNAVLDELFFGRLHTVTGEDDSSKVLTAFPGQPRSDPRQKVCRRVSLKTKPLIKSERALLLTVDMLRDVQEAHDSMSEN